MGRGPIATMLQGNPTIKYKPESSVLGLKVGDLLDIDVDDYVKPAAAFLDEIERAMALLRGGDRSVTEVCFAVGCSSLGTFSTASPT
jgi:hypothetical protein